MAQKTKSEPEHKYLFQRGDVWWISFRRKGQNPLIQSTEESDIRNAREERDRLLATYMVKDEKERAAIAYSRVQTKDALLTEIKDKIPACSIRNGWQAYIDQPNRPDTGENTLEVYRLQYEAMAKWMSEHYPDVEELRHLSSDHATGYAGHLLKIVSASTFNRHVNLLALVWRTLKNKARIKDNPWDAEHITRKKIVARSRRELTVEEINRIMNTATGEMRILLALGLYCGLRLGDAACLRWGDVDMVRRIITIIPMKTARRQKRVVIPIHKTLFMFLDMTPKNKRVGAVLPAMLDRYSSHDGLSKDIAKLFLDCDIKTNVNKLTKSERETAEEDRQSANKSIKKTGKRAAPERGFHSLRHSFVSLCAAGGVAQSVVQSLVGHGSPAMTQHYTHIGLETAQNAIALLPSVTGKEVIEEKNDAKLEDLKKLLSGLTDKGLEEIATATKKEIQKRKAKKKPAIIDVAETSKN